MRFNKINDLYFTESGDFVLGTNGDLEDTKNDFYRGFIQRIDTRMRSSKGDWRCTPDVGAGLTDFMGKRNTQELGRLIKSRIYTELYQDDLLRSAEVVVDVLPMSGTQVAIVLIITPPGTTGQIALTYTYSLKDNKIMLRNV